ncbi:hypothetical protein Tco_1137239 [Tanacetum coccineum]
MLHLCEHATQWSNLVGKIIREYPMYYLSWHKIKEEEKKARFLEKLMNGIDHHMAKVYINNKSDLKAKHWIIGPDETCDVSGIRCRPPANIKQTEWDTQVDYWLDPKHVARALQNAQN